MKLKPKLLDGGFDYFCLKANCDIPKNAVAAIKESEGLTVIVPAEKITSKTFAWITNDFETSLTAVGITAKFAKALCDSGISCNILAGFHHDHILVPYSVKEKAVKILQNVEI
jgi:hypothetical protein